MVLEAIADWLSQHEIIAANQIAYGWQDPSMRTSVCIIHRGGFEVIGSVGSNTRTNINRYQIDVRVRAPTITAVYDIAE